MLRDKWRRCLEALEVAGHLQLPWQLLHAADRQCLQTGEEVRQAGVVFAPETR
jgi:hypothetical protein